MERTEYAECPPLPPRPADGHKGTFGRILLVGGSTGMSGAVCLSGKAALRSGSGLVSVAVPCSIQPIVAGYEPSYMTIGLSEDSAGQLLLPTSDLLQRKLVGMDAVGIGPGLGQSQGVCDLVRWIIQTVHCPLVIDADALNAAAQERMFPSVGPGSRGGMARRVITPHPGEFSRLTGFSVEEILDNRESIASDFARENGLIVVLKGPETIVTDGHLLYRNPTGNSGMATGGTGDVLTGVLTSLLGQRMAPFDAASLAVYVHGLAGDLAAVELSGRGLIASDLLDYLPRAWKVLESTSAK